MTVFRKNVNCPSSEKLLAFQKGIIANGECDKITIHLRFCEFCAAEVEFYKRYPQAEEPVEKSEIPRALYELAEALLSDKKKDFLENLFHKPGS
jgi:hypothetical protein